MVEITITASIIIIIIIIIICYYLMSFTCISYNILISRSTWST